MDNLQRLRAVYQLFDKVHRVTDADYVDFDVVRGQSVLEPLRQRFLFSGGGAHVAQLFGGGRGSGKTTELLRFKEHLKNSGFAAVYIDVEKTIDVNSCKFGDYLFAIALGVRQALNDEDADAYLPGASSLGRYFDSKVEEIWGLFGARLRAPGLELNAAGVKAGLKLERPPSSRDALEAEMESISSDATQGVRDMLMKLSETVTKAGRQGLVLLVDGADKISPYPPDDSSVEQHVRIFAHRATYLCSLGCHMVYSVPLSFCYSPDAQTFCRTAAVESPIILPNTSLNSKRMDKDGKEVTGTCLFRQMVDLRLKTIKEKTEDVFAEDALSHAIEQSGGNPDSFAVILQGALVRMKGDLPLQRKAVEDSVQEISNGMSRQVKNEWWDLLRELRTRQNYPDKSSEDFRLCLYYHYIYEYANGEPKFEVNPVLRRLERMAG